MAFRSAVMQFGFPLASPIVASCGRHEHRYRCDKPEREPKCQGSHDDRTGRSLRARVAIARGSR